MKKWLKLWASDESNIFNDWKDALFGFAISICLPFMSLLSLIFTKELNYTQDSSFWTYSFPTVSIAISGIFDSIMRMSPKLFRNFKLYVRIALDAVCVIWSSAAWAAQIFFIRLFPAIILIVSGLLLSLEIFNNWKLSYKISPFAGK